MIGACSPLHHCPSSRRLPGRTLHAPGQPASPVAKLPPPLLFPRAFSGVFLSTDTDCTSLSFLRNHQDDSSEKDMRNFAYVQAFLIGVLLI